MPKKVGVLYPWEEHWMAAGFSPHPKLGRIAIVETGGGYLSVSCLGRDRSIQKHGLAEHIAYHFGVSGTALSRSALSMAQSPREFPLMFSRAFEKWMAIQRGGPKTIFNFPDALWKIPFAKEIHFRNVEGLLNNRVLYNLLGDYDPALTVRSPIEFNIRVFNHSAGKYEIISNHDSRFDPAHGGDPGLFSDFLVGSACLDLFFDPIYIDDVAYSDGDSFDILPAIEYGCDTILVFSGHDKAYKASEGGAYAEIKNRAPMVIRSILNKYNSLRQQDEYALQRAFRRIGQITKEREEEARNAPIGEKILRSARRFGKYYGDLMREAKRDPNSFLATAWHSGIFPRNLFSFDVASQEKFPQIIHLYKSDAIPKSLTPTSFKEGDLTRAIEAAEKQLDEVLETML